MVFAFAVLFFFLDVLILTLLLFYPLSPLETYDDAVRSGGEEVKRRKRVPFTIDTEHVALLLLLDRTAPDALFLVYPQLEKALKVTPPPADMFLILPPFFSPKLNRAASASFNLCRACS
jgi:hypothetical protein